MLFSVWVLCPVYNMISLYNTLLHGPACACAPGIQCDVVDVCGRVIITTISTICIIMHNHSLHIEMCHKINIVRYIYVQRHTCNTCTHTCTPHTHVHHSKNTQYNRKLSMLLSGGTAFDCCSVKSSRNY